MRGANNSTSPILQPRISDTSDVAGSVATPSPLWRQDRSPTPRMAWRTVAQYCERALRARGERARAAALERAGWVNLNKVTPAEGTQAGWLPAGLLLVVFVASQAQRVAFLPEQRTLCMCGMPQDLKV